VTQVVEVVLGSPPLYRSHTRRSRCKLLLVNPQCSKVLFLSDSATAEMVPATEQIVDNTLLMPSTLKLMPIFYSHAQRDGSYRQADCGQHSPDAFNSPDAN
jgi:hypothetical protein